MDRRIKLLLTLLVTAVLATDAIGYLPFLSTRQIRLNAPVSGFTYAHSFIASGDAWTPTGLPPVEVRASHPASGTALTFTAERLKVKYRGVVANELAIFSTRLTLPREGTWEVQAWMRDPSGAQPAELASKTRTITVQAGASDHLFRAFGTEHLIMFAVLIALFASVVLRYRKPRSEAEVRVVSLMIGPGVLINELAYHVYWVVIDGFSASNSLMLHMCGISIFLVPFLLFMKPGKGRQRLFEISWFWGLGAAFQAYLAPDIWTHSFPELRFFSFFISHGLLVLGPLFFVLTSGSQLTFGSCLRAGTITLGTTALMWGIDQIPRVIPPYEPSNYFMIAYPPPTGSIIDTFADIFGPSPAYGIGLIMMGIVLFSVLYLPFPIIRRIGGRSSPAQSARPGE
jgi:hypothetical integral membrane protein (TIGR02206 family)